MSDIWYISADLWHPEVEQGEKLREIVYKMDEAQEYAEPNLGNVLLWCRDACETLISKLEKEKADTKDIEFVKKEIEFIKQAEDRWRTVRK